VAKELCVKQPSGSFSRLITEIKAHLAAIRLSIAEFERKVRAEESLKREGSSPEGCAIPVSSAIWW